ncbi:glycerol-3-phosphate dehydrogenase subunit C [Saccharobesus litoralis]|uniref:Glycerol-3-phosphate dehydrogenase subunit C n=2 Tax=Saccharobesus litoralis TaxID=2172099 RepID=A0A2S0VXX1_9ALTE|nr:glycerol-3-phosphate dehydrogenase subunit C [Saccharobesus litoralis]
MPVNEQVTDSVTQVNTSVVGETPAIGLGNLQVSTSQALGISALNASETAQQAGIVLQTATVQGVNSLMSTCTAVLGRSSESVIE